MLFYLELLLEIIIGYKILFEKEKTKLFLWFLASAILLHPGFKYGQGVPAVNWMIPIIGMCRLVKDRSLFSFYRLYPLKYLFGVLLLFHFIQPLFSSFRDLGITYFYIIQYTMSTYLYLFLGFCFAPDYHELLKRKKWIYVMLFIISAIAIISSYYEYNFISEEIVENTIWTSEKAETERGFRTTSTVASPNVFGYINVLFLLFVIRMRGSYFGKGIALLLIMTNIVLCATRAPMAGLFFSLGVYLLMERKGTVLKGVISTLLALSLISYFYGTNETIDKYFSGVTDLFLTGSENTGGSTVELRQAQLAYSMTFADDKPFWGQGLGFCNSILDEESPNHVYFDKDLAGAEGYAFYLLIDYGYIYIAIVILYFLYIIVFFIKNSVKYRDICVLGLPVTIALLVHLVTSRPDNSWQVFMPVIGACMGMIVFARQRRKMIGI